MLYRKRQPSPRRESYRPAEVSRAGWVLVEHSGAPCGTAQLALGALKEGGSFIFYGAQLVSRPVVAYAGGMHETTLRVRRLDPGGQIPEYKSALAAGMDLAACLDGSITLEPGAMALVPTGIAIAIEPGFEGQVRPRSGLACKFGVTVPNAPGTIDADYRGEVRVGLINLGHAPFVIEPGMRIAQLVIAPVARAEIIEVKALDETVRGSGGFGSTGVGGSTDDAPVRCSS